MRRIWVEAEDYIRYFDGSVTPTGIGRVQAEMFRQLAARHPERVAFCRIGHSPEQVEALDHGAIVASVDVRHLLGQPDRLLPALRRLARFAVRRTHARLGWRSGSAARRRFMETVRPGDVLVTLGATWGHNNYARTVAALKARHGLRFALLVHDVLPLSHPDLVSPGFAPLFREWFAGLAPLADLLLAPSQSTAAAVRDALAERGRPVPPLETIPFGRGFAAAPVDDLPLERRRHVLYVSTIEVRKNHLLLFRVWERLIAEHGREHVPDLVFAGKWGWQVAPLKAALRKSGFLGGKIRVAQNLSDEALAVAYRRALFTVFPSLAEGWGLPVSESLHHGRYCIASHATSIPEAGGRFVDYHDPHDQDAAYRLIERAIFEPGLIAAKERLIREGMAPQDWSGAADALLEAVDRHLP